MFGRTINIMSGAPGSGKSSFVEKTLGPGQILCSRDSFRSALRERLNSTKYFPVSADEEWDLWIFYIGEQMRDNPHFDIWIDQTTIGTGALRKLLLGLFYFLRDTDRIQIYYMNTPLSTCLARNAERPEFTRVTTGALTAMWERARTLPLTPHGVRQTAAACGIKNPIKARWIS